MADLIQHFKASAAPHFVTLSCVQTLANGEEKPLIFSGFLAEVVDAWVYVTAGHVLRDIRKAIDAGLSFDVWRLGDQTAGHEFKDTGVPFHFELDEWLVIEDEVSGLDYAVIGIRDFYRAQLEVGGAKPLTRNTWVEPSRAPGVQWVVMGVPSESVQYDGQTILTAKFVIIALEPCDAPSGANDRSGNQIYARLIGGSEGVAANADGLSGGPVFAVWKPNDTWMYGVIGVQSTWFANQRVVAFCPWSTFAAELEREIAAARNA
jgi:hypothetical protein